MAVQLPGGSFYLSPPAVAADPALVTRSLRLDAPAFRTLFEMLGPSLGLWRAAEVAALREQVYPAPVLDLGCGDGIVTSMVLPHVEIGLDPDDRALAQAAALGLYGRLIPRPVEWSGLPDGSVGTIVSNSVLEHIPDLDAVLAATARLLRRDGRLIFTVPTETFSSWLALRRPGYVAWRNRRLMHLNLWSVAEWRRRLERVGLQVEVVRPYLRRPYVQAWDATDLLEQARIGRTRLVGPVWRLLWRRLPGSVLDRLAARAAQLDLSARPSGGGRLIVARKLS